MYLIRKIEQQKDQFEKTVSLCKCNYKSAAYLKYFLPKTMEISLYCTDDIDEIKKIITAISIGADKLQTSTYIYAKINPTLLKEWENNKNISFGQSDGETKWPELNKKHYYLKNLEATKLGFFCENFMSLFENEGCVDVLSQPEIIKIVNSNKEKILISSLHNVVKKALGF